MNHDKLTRCQAELKSWVLSRLDGLEEIRDREVLELIDGAILERGRMDYLSLEEKGMLRRELFNSLRKLDVIQELVDADDVTEIMINGAGHIFVERNGALSEWDRQFETEEKLWDVIQRIVSRTNRIVNETTPIVDARLEDGSRVNVVLPPIAIDGPVVTIRRFPREPITMERLLKLGSIDERTADFLAELVRRRYNVFISGGTGSGKTTFLNVLSEFIPKEERIITIEDAAELQIRGIPNLVRLETRNANFGGKNEIGMRELIRTALRMRPDRIIIGETRGAECAELLQAMNTGHAGSLSTGHANSARDMLTRMEMMVLMGLEVPLTAIQRQIATAIDVVVHLGRLRDGSRRVLEVTEVEGLRDGEFVLNPLVSFVPEGEEAGRIRGRLEWCGELRNERGMG